ncbi:hypothetical protein AXF42_Ash007148 [Apostasia shenzhenica]|uniref:BED-type domain-containing protein n=1 Tax=Apostasia shenzhenica TaxID=1088818 RepID=A0A2I0BF72_9ASPA|nr:hypothetical protein AXF42_Ash007148 [Apostasia shenzhenica]
MSTANSACAQSSQNSTDPPPPSASIRQRTDITWNYVTDIKNPDGKKWIKCDFCQKNFKGGGIHRVKLHLAKKKGDVVESKSKITQGALYA